MTLPNAARRYSGTSPTGEIVARECFNRVSAIFLNQREASITLIAVIVFIYFAATTTQFFSHGSFVNIAQYMGPYVIIGIGLVLLMVCGEIDLSVGFVWTLSPFVMHFFIDSGFPTFLAIVVTVLLCSLVGLLNGVVTTVFGVPSLITTLGSGYLVYGYTLTISSAQQINLPAQAVGLGRWFGGEAWSEIIWASVLVLLFHVLLRRTRWGLYTVSVGGNLLGAREAGIKVNRIKIGNFMMCQLARGVRRDPGSLQDRHHRPERRPARGGARGPGRRGHRRYGHARRGRHDDRDVGGRAGARRTAGRLQPARHQFVQVPDDPEAPRSSSS